MHRSYNRKEFIKVGSLSALGLLLAACGFDTEEKHPPEKNSAKDTAAKKPSLLASENENVIYVTKESERFSELNIYFNKRIQKTPAVIALCKNTLGVSEAVKYAIEKKLPIAIRSGGHSFEGFSNAESGLVINLTLMNSIEWIGDEKVQLGPGVKLSQLYDAILPKKRIIPAGSCAGVGIAGLALGGGYGFFSRKYGLCCDNLLEIELVDGQGNFHSSRDDEKLLWACRGGGNGNFGVVTKMIFSTHEAPENFQSHRFKAFNLDATRAASILETWFSATSALPESCFCAFVLNGKNLTILLTNYEEHTPVIQKCIDALSALCDKSTQGAPVPVNKALKPFYGIQTPIFFKNASAGLYKDFTDINVCIKNVIEKVIATPGLIYQVNTLGGKINDPAFENASCYAHRALPYLSELQAYWEKPERAEKLISEFETIQGLFFDNGIKAQYVNYPDLHFKDWQTAYYGDNYAKLQEIKKRYDPENKFRHEQSVVV